VNSARCKKDADETFLTLMTVSEKYMHISLDYLGYLPYDTHVQVAVRTRKAFSVLFPKIFLTQCVRDIAQNLLNREEQVKGSLQFFIGNLLSTPVNTVQNKPLNAESVVER
jgi:flagellar biosynthesis protein FlhG